MKEQQAQSDRERRQMALNRENILQEQKKLRLLNQQLMAQVSALQNNPVQTEGDTKKSRYPNLCTLEELIQKWIEEARLLDHSTPTTKIHKSPLQTDPKV